MILGKIDEIVALAKVYMQRYNISPLDAVECAMRDIEKELENEQRD